MVGFLNGWDQCYSNFYSPTDLQKVLISDVSGFQMAGFQGPTVYNLMSTMKFLEMITHLFADFVRN